MPIVFAKKPHSMKREMISGALDMSLLQYNEIYALYQCYVFACKICLQLVRQVEENNNSTQML